MTDESIAGEKPVSKMTKDELLEFGLQIPGCPKLNPTWKIDKIRATINASIGKHEEEAALNEALARDDFDEETVQAEATMVRKPRREEKPEPAQKIMRRFTHLKHPENGRVYVKTPLLIARGDMLPCDEHGKLV